MVIAKNILVATDFSELGQAALEQGLVMAERLDAKLNVVSVFPHREKSEGLAQFDRALRELRGKLDELEQRLQPSGRLGKTLLHFGEPAPTILAAAREVNADMLVLGTNARRGLGRLIMGSTAEAVLRDAGVPVLIVKQPEPAPSVQVDTRLESRT